MNKLPEDAVVDMRWLHEGTPDPFPEYHLRVREDLPMASFSDDALANYAFMNYDRDMNTEVAVMMNPGGPHYPKIAFMTSIKERMRWLSRRLAIAEGRYPGVYIPNEVILRVKEQERLAGHAHQHLTGALCSALGHSVPTFADRIGILNRVTEVLRPYDIPEELFNKAFNTGSLDARSSTNSETLVNLRELVMFVEAAAGFKVKPQPYKVTDATGDCSHKGVTVRVLDDTEIPAEEAGAKAEVIIDQDSIDRRIEPEGQFAHRKAHFRWTQDVLGIYMAFGLEHANVSQSFMVKKIQAVVDVPERDIRMALGYDSEPDAIKRLGVFNELCKQLNKAGTLVPVREHYDIGDVNPAEAAKAIGDEILVNIFGTSDTSKIPHTRRPTDMSEGSVIAENEARLVPAATKREYNPKDFATNQGDIAWSTLMMTRDCPPGYVTKAPGAQQGDTYLGTHVESRLNGAVLHGFIDKHGLKVTYFCTKQGELREILRWAGDDLTRKYYEFIERTPPADVASQLQEGDRYIRPLSKNEAPTSGTSYYAEEVCTGRLAIYHFTDRGNLVSRHQLDRFYIAAEHPEELQPVPYSVEHRTTVTDEQWASECWSTEIHGLYAVFGGRTHETSRDAIVDKIFSVIALTPKFNMELVLGALGFNQELDMIGRLSLFHVLAGHLGRAGHYVPLNGDTIFTPDDSGYSQIVKSRVYLSGQIIQVRPGVHLNLVKQITKQG